MSKRKLWIDTTGQPVITTTANGVSNARRWGWVEGEALPVSGLARERAAARREGQAEAWAEGESDGRYNAIEHRERCKLTNPYRNGADQ